jgi:tetratricopeptide (TPR) repeat protein
VTSHHHFLTDHFRTDGPAALPAHRRLRGPYTAAGGAVRAVVRGALQVDATLIARHDVELLTVAPELDRIVTCQRDTLTSVSSPEERTRFYPRARTRRVAHGVTEFLNGYVAASGRAHSLVIAGIDHADATDAEWLAILLRRSDPAHLRIVTTGLIEGLPPELAAALRQHSEIRPVVAAVDTRHDAGRDAGLLERAALHVERDGIDDDAELLTAYRAVTDDERAALHDARAIALETRDEPSLRLGAIPYHRERGRDPAGAGAAALLAAIEHGVLMGFYDSVVELGRRTLDLLDWRDRPEDCWLVVAKMATALTALDRPDEAAALYDEACAASTLPSVHLQAAYGRAMLFTRFYDDDRLDHGRAKAWINTAIAISSLMEEGERRAFNLTFNENGLALIEMHLGDAEEALRLVTAGLDRLDAGSDPERHALHRSVLRYNRAQLLGRIGPPEAAVQEYDRVIESDPHHSEYYFERAALLRRLGRSEAAMADYREAIRLSPPYPEPHFNLADLAAELGDAETARAHLDYVLELEPDFVEAHVARATLDHQLDDPGSAAAHVEAGLALDPRHPRLLCLAGSLALDDGRLDDARRALDAALEVDDSLVEAWANRAVVSFERGDAEAAVADLTAALALEDSPDLRLNRALALEILGRHAEAGLDHDHAHRLAAAS